MMRTVEEIIDELRNENHLRFATVNGKHIFLSDVEIDEAIASKAQMLFEQERVIWEQQQKTEARRRLFTQLGLSEEDIALLIDGNTPEPWTGDV